MEKETSTEIIDAQRAIMQYTNRYMKALRLWLPVVCWMIIIFLLSNRQKLQVSEELVINFIFFKTLHVLEYAILFVLNYRATKYTFQSDNPKLWGITALMLTVIYAVSDETHQLFVPTREGKMRDVIIDTFGGMIAWGTILLLLPKMPKKLQKLGSRWQLL